MSGDLCRTTDAVKTSREVQRGGPFYSHTQSSDSSLLSSQEGTKKGDELRVASIASDSPLGGQLVRWLEFR